MDSAFNTMMKNGITEVRYYQNCTFQRIFENFLELMSSVNVNACGKCAPCRIGHIRMEEIIKRIINKQGKQNDLETLYNIAKTLNEISHCPLGRKVPSRIINSIDHLTMIE